MKQSAFFQCFFGISGSRHAIFFFIIKTVGEGDGREREGSEQRDVLKKKEEEEIFFEKI